MPSPKPYAGSVSKRHQQRQQMMACLYMQDMQPEENIEMLYHAYCEEIGISDELDSSSFILETLRKIRQHQASIDTILQQHAENWAFGRIAKVELAILRLGIYELCFGASTPPPVVINEAIELSKEYASEDSKRFINGVLDRIATEKTSSC